MRKTLREKRSHEYWAERWTKTPVDEPARGADCYPLHYANIAVPDSERGEVLELGCGAGRLLRYYRQRGVSIVGVDNAQVVVKKLQAFDASLDVHHADARALPFAGDRFSAVLCFGVYHCLEHGADLAISESYRVLTHGGVLCAEFRSDNLHNAIIDFYKGFGRRRVEFHKWNYSNAEARKLLQASGFEVVQEFAAVNMPILYHWRFLRHQSQKIHDEHACRRDGYRMRPGADGLMKLLLRLAPRVFCNEHIFICRKPMSDLHERQ